MIHRFEYSKAVKVLLIPEQNLADNIFFLNGPERSAVGAPTLVVAFHEITVWRNSYDSFQN